jgi:hypothetical protein
VSDEEDKRLAPGNRTIQVDALTDVELIESAAAEAAAAEEGAPAAPPPLPPRTSLPAAKPEAKPAGVPWLAIAITVVVTGTLGALGAHFLVPAAAPPETPTPPAATPAPTAPAAPAEVRRVTLEDEVIISAESPDAGLAAPE